MADTQSRIVPRNKPPTCLPYSMAPHEIIGKLRKEAKDKPGGGETLPNPVEHSGEQCKNSGTLKFPTCENNVKTSSELPIEGASDQRSQTLCELNAQAVTFIPATPTTDKQLMQYNLDPLATPFFPDDMNSLAIPSLPKNQPKPDYRQGLYPGFSNYKSSNKKTCFLQRISAPKEMPVDRSPYIQVFGHSFISRISEALYDKNAEFHDIIISHIEDWTTAFDVEVELFGISGGKFEHLKKQERKIKKTYPDAIIVEYGTNDLCNNKMKPTHLAENMVELIQKWIDNDWTRIATICHITPRSEMTPFFASKCEKELDWFNSDVDVYNKHLVNLIKSHPKIDHWRHYGLRLSDKKVSRDGIHPNTRNGFIKYCSSLTGAILECRQKLLVMT